MNGKSATSRKRFVTHTGDRPQLKRERILQRRAPHVVELNIATELHWPFEGLRDSETNLRERTGIFVIPFESLAVGNTGRPRASAENHTWPQVFRASGAHPSGFSLTVRSRSWSCWNEVRARDDQAEQYRCRKSGFHRSRSRMMDARSPASLRCTSRMSKHGGAISSCVSPEFRVESLESGVDGKPEVQSRLAASS